MTKFIELFDEDSQPISVNTEAIIAFRPHVNNTRLTEVVLKNGEEVTFFIPYEDLKKALV